eukprot:4709462-Prymnesium_polylepis.2
MPVPFWIIVPCAMHRAMCDVLAIEVGRGTGRRGSFARLRCSAACSPVPSVVIISDRRTVEERV